MNRITSSNRRGSRLDELDAWVLEEVEALSLTTRMRSADPARLRSRSADRPRPTKDEFEELLEPLESPEPPCRRTHHARPQRPVCRLPEEPIARRIGLFDEAETDFIEQGVAWLSGRPNADMILEEMWCQVVAEPADERAPSAFDLNETPDVEHVDAVSPTQDAYESDDKRSYDEESFDGGACGEEEHGERDAASVGVEKPDDQG